MTLDTVISGCVVYFLENSEGLDPQRCDIVETCLADLNELLPDLTEEPRAYFERLSTLGTLVLRGQQPPEA